MTNTIWQWQNARHEMTIEELKVFKDKTVEASKSKAIGENYKKLLQTRTSDINTELLKRYKQL